jgi:hypothetical protein
MFNLILNSLKYEKIHHHDDQINISSTFNNIFFKSEKNEIKIVLPINLKEKCLGFFRITRRLFRLDMCNVFKSENQLIIIRGGWVYNYDLTLHKLTKTLQLKQCRNILHQSISKVPNGDLYFGEYGMNPNRNEVNVYRSHDNGKTWHIIYTFPKGSIRHVHGCYYDKYSESILTLTGDFNGENLIQISDLEFRKNKVLGDGSQSYRAVNLFFTETEIHWIMDSPIEKSYQYKYDRNSGEITKLNFFEGPIWYLKSLEDGYFLAGSSVEIGNGVLSDKACLYVSKDLIKWEVLKEFKKDFWPMPYFKWGVIAFSDGRQTSKNFTLHFEGLKKVDGKSFMCSIEKKYK